jgi:hypothetical protein
MEKEFIPYEQALALKELGFDEPCMCFYNNRKELKVYHNIHPHQYVDKDWDTLEHQLLGNSKITLTNTYSAPTYSQIFRWFREKYGLYHSIALDNSLEDDVNCDYQIINHNQSISELETDFKSYEEAELECLKKLIQIVKPQP